MQLVRDREGSRRPHMRQVRGLERRWPGGLEVFRKASTFLSLPIFNLCPYGHPRAPAWEKLNLRNALWAVKATSILWGQWLRSDEKIRADYSAGIIQGSKEILARVNKGEITSVQGFELAVDMRNNTLLDARRHSSPVGLLAAKWMKPRGLTQEEEEVLEKYTDVRYGQRVFADLTEVEAVEAYKDAIAAASHAKF
ncbi:hypothetical protein BDZ91DRAFT_802668 [Kalaharituber pfeilii]|nr:hypothetical protein BDZ91DRAFT_802668 [Kalaharituber pfeilii]